MKSCGFRKKGSCETQLLSTIEEIASSTARGQHAEVILLDFAKAFDNLPHTRIVHKLDFYGVKNKTKKWIEFFLRQRNQEVVLDGVRHSRGHVRSASGYRSRTSLILVSLPVNTCLPKNIQGDQQ